MRGTSLFLAYCVFVLAGLSSSPSWASHEREIIPEQERHDSGWEIYIDNDAFSLLPLDQDYTGGIAVTHYGKRVIGYPLAVESLRSKIDRLTGSGRYQSKDVFKLHSFGYGFSSFTPKDTSVSTPIYNDRPYASLVYIASTQQVVLPHENQVFQSTLMVGVLGLRVAELFQNSVHSALGQGTAQGWDNQISNGGELTFRYTLARQATYVKHYVKSGADYEIKGTGDISIGYITDVSVGLSGRLGDIRSPWWSFNPRPLDYINMGVPTNRTGRDSGVEELFVWGGLGLRYRFYNALLQGQFLDSAVTFSSSELNPWILEGTAGVTKRFLNGYSLSFVLRANSNELKIGEKRNPVWASFIIGRNF
jgi:hypothetical protein